MGRSGRGGYCFTHRIESRQKLPTLLVSFLRLPACKNWEAKTREPLLLGISCSLWCGAELESQPPRSPHQARYRGRSELDARPRQGLRPGKGRSSKTIPSRRKEKWAPHCTSMGSLGAAAPKRPFRPFWAAPKGPRARGRETSPGRHCQKDKVGAESPGGPCPSPSSQSCLTPAPAYSSSSGTHSIRSPG